MRAMGPEAGVSIVIPNWNHEILLPRSIGSALRALDVLRDEELPGEVLVIDDASRDGSHTLLRQLEALYYKDGLRCVTFGVNGGMAAGRNQSLMHARYRYLVFLDADNELVPENLPLFIRTLVETRAAACYGNLLIRTVTGDYAHYVTSNESFQKRLFWGGNYLDTFSVCDRLQLIDVGGFNGYFYGIEDYEMWLRLATSGRRIVSVPAVLGYYYLLPTSVSSDLQKQHGEMARIRRVFDQVRAREHLDLNTCHLRYHPELGYI
jgi:glycosyltransferase involved in cell wall biosynthesis